MSSIPDWAESAVEALLLSVKFKDEFTYSHCCRVGLEAKKLARFMGLDEFQQTLIEFSGLLHDIGKVGVADNILLKPARLTDAEFKKMRSHPELSVSLIKPLSDKSSFFRMLVPGVRFHHERFDGRGYPNGVSGSDIPLPARILAVVDTVDAMTNSRPYRNALSMDIARAELVKFSGTQFDGDIVKKYLESLDAKVDDDMSFSSILLAS